MHPKVYIGSDGIYVDCFKEGEKDRSQTLHCVHVHDHRDGLEACEEFLKYFTWEPMDGQHVHSECVDIASAEIKARSITIVEYELMYSK